MFNVSAPPVEGFVTVSDQVFVNGSMFNFASSKFIEREPVVPSGLVTAPSQLPVKVSRKAIGEAVGVGGNGVGDKGVAVGEAQADSTHSRRRVEMMRMGVNITQLVVFITTLQRGLLKRAGWPRPYNNEIFFEFIFKIFPSISTTSFSNPKKLQKVTWG